MKSIAEWAEDCATVESLSKIGVDYVQGFAIATPQEPGRLLLAESSASFIEDESVATFVRDTLARDRAKDLLDQPGDISRLNLH